MPRRSSPQTVSSRSCITSATDDRAGGTKELPRVLPPLEVQAILDGCDQGAGHRGR